MELYNTLTKKIEKLVPHKDGEINMYTCGPTVYNYAHIGNLRTYIFEDVLEKALKLEGYKVNRAMNITDVGHMTDDGDNGEDKMSKASRLTGKSPIEIALFYTEAFFQDLKKLNIRKPDIVSKATDNINEYIKIIEKLLDMGYAYTSNGNVYFDVTKFDNYYELSGKNPDDLKIGVRDGVDEDKSKKNPFDFGLWMTNSKFANQILKWDSPWGVGYPGWHIECSGIAIKYLGEYLDIHCGGIDSVFPHHTNEIAQSETYLGHKWCSFWVHPEHLNDKTGKMSKSKGEFLTISVLEDKGYDPLAYRLFCLQSHYKNQLIFSYDSLDIAQNTYDKLKAKIKNLIVHSGNYTESEINEEYYNKFIDALDDNINTSNALTILYDVIKDENLTNDEKLKLISIFDSVLSLSLLEMHEDGIDEDLRYEIELKIKERLEAKKNKDYNKADQIRLELEEKGIILKDTREGTIYEMRRK